MNRVEVGTGIIAGASIIMGIGALLAFFGIAPHIVLTGSASLYLVGIVVGCLVLETRK